MAKEAWQLTEEWYDQNRHRLDSYIQLFGSEMAGAFVHILRSVGGRIRLGYFADLDHEMTDVPEDQIVERYMQRVFARLDLMKEQDVNPLDIWTLQQMSPEQAAGNLVGTHLTRSVLMENITMYKDWVAAQRSRHVV